MKWFNKDEFETARKYINSGDSAALKEWYWGNYKQNATTLTLAFVYAVINKKDSACIKRLKGLLNPPGKDGPAIYNDVVSEIWRHDSVKAIRTLDVLVDEGINFQIKDGDALNDFLNNPKFKKVADAIEQKPSIISKYMHRDQMDKTLTTLLASSSYEVVKAALEPYAYYANRQERSSYGSRGNRKAPWSQQKGVATTQKVVTTADLLRKTALIKDNANRVKYIKEVVFGSTTAYVEDLFGEILKIVKSTTMTGSDVVKVLEGLSPSNKGTYSATKLLFELHNRGEKEDVKDIARNWPGKIWDGVLDDIRYYSNSVNNKQPEYQPIWLEEYFDFIGKDALIKLLSKVDTDTNDFSNAIVGKFPESISDMMKICPDKVPKTIHDIFIF